MKVLITKLCHLLHFPNSTYRGEHHARPGRCILDSMLPRRLHLSLQEHLFPEGQQMLVLSEDDFGKEENIQRARYVSLFVQG